MVFNNNNGSEVNLQKHLCIALDNRLSFEEHLKTILKKLIKLGI